MRSATFSVLVLVASAWLPAAAQQALEPSAKGDQQRRYDFAEARAEMPYRLYVPQSYDPARKIPLVVALHGYGGDQNYFFASLPTLPDLARAARIHPRRTDGVRGRRLVRRAALDSGQCAREARARRHPRRYARRRRKRVTAP